MQGGRRDERRGGAGGAALGVSAVLQVQLAC